MNEGIMMRGRYDRPTGVGEGRETDGCDFASNAYSPWS